MTRFIHRLGRTGLVALLVAGLALAAGASLTLAKGKVKKHKAKATVRLVALDQSATYPSPGSTVLSTGTIKANLGNGAVVQNATITGHPTATTYTITTTATDFFARGTVKASASGTVTAHADGSLSVSGSGRYKGGTGKLKKAKGKFTFTGSSPKPVANKPTVLTANIKGTISY